MTYEQLAIEMGVLYQVSKAWQDDDEWDADPYEGGGWDQLVQHPGGIETHALQNLSEDSDSEV